MTNYKRLIKLPVPAPGAAHCTGFVLPGDYVPRTKVKRLKKEALVRWEDEGGSLAESAGAAQSQ